MNTATEALSYRESASDSRELETLERMWISERSRVVQDEHGRELAEQIKHSSSAIVVLYGRERSGKSELVRGIVPLLSENARVVRRSILDDAPDVQAEKQPTIEIWDNADQALNDETRRTRLVEHLRSASMSIRAVLVVSDTHLRELLSLRSALPGLLDEVIEMPFATAESLTSQLQLLLQDFGVTLSAELSTSIQHDLVLASSTGPLTSALLILLAFELWRCKSAGQLSAETYERSGGLRGALGSVLDVVCDHISATSERELCWAVLDAIVGGDGLTQEQALSDLACRFDVSDGVPAEIQQRLVEHHVLSKTLRDVHVLVTDQLEPIVRAWRQRMSEAAHAARTILRQGARQFAECDTLLSESTFLKVHAQRSAIPTCLEEAKLMVRCALAYGDDDELRATAHWLRRLAGASAATEVLLEGSFDARADVRARSVRYMRTQPQLELKHRLHTLALRDPEQGVREEAIDALAAVAADDTSIRSQLLAEMAALSTPYRLQAIAALRAYPVANTVERLGALVEGNRPQEDSAARAAAIAVLGRHDTFESAQALLQIALRDQDREDREAAVAALCETRRDDVARYVLELLREARPSARPKARRDFQAFRDAALAFFAAWFASSVTVLLHGLSLLTLRRWRAAVVVTVLELAGCWVMMSSASWGLALFALSLLAGLLVPARMLWLELDEGIRAQAAEYRRGRAYLPPLVTFSERYRFMLAWFLVLSVPLTFSLALHGLFSALVKRYGRAAYCFGLELFGLMLVYCAAYWQNELGAYASLTPAFEWIPRGFQYVGWTAFGASWLVDVASVLYGIFLRREAHRTSERVDTICSSLSSNRFVLEQLGAALRGDASQTERVWAIRVLLRHAPGTAFRGVIDKLWRDADASARRVLISLLARRCDETSLELLRERDQGQRWSARGRYFAAKVRLARALLPKGTLELLSLICLTFFAAAFLLFVQNAHRPDKLQAVILQHASGPTQWVVGSQKDAGRKLAKLVTIEGTDESLGHAALTALSNVFEESAPYLDDSKEVVLQELIRSAPTAKRLAQTQVVFERALAKSLTKRQLLEPTLKALSVIDTEISVKELITFVESLAHGGETSLAPPAIRALSDVRSQPSERLQAFTRWQDGARFPSEITRAAEEAFRKQPALARADLLYERGVASPQTPQAQADLASAIDLASSARNAEPPCDEECLQHARDVMIRAHVRLGQLAYLRPPNTNPSGADAMTVTAAGHLNQILQIVDESRADLSGDVLDEVLTFGVAVCYHEHEFKALFEPAAYMRNYDWLLRLQAIVGRARETVSEQVPPTQVWKTAIEANLIEASITTGRYSDALKIARKLALDVEESRSEEPSLILNVKFLELAALLLMSRSAEAETVERDLRGLAKVSNNWSYRGLMHYVDRSALKQSDKSRLRKALTLIGAGTLS